jgi:YggT family protein
VSAPLIFLIKTFSDLYLLCFLLRVLLQAVRADFYNPISQFIVRATNPLVKPARRIAPSVRGLDLPTIIVLILLELVVTAVLLALFNVRPGFDQLIWLALFRLVALVLWTYTVCIFVYVVLSWVAQASYSPIAMLIGQVVEPVLRPARRLLPALGGLDLSPLIVLVLIQAASIALVSSIAPLLISPGLTALIR